MESFRLLMGIHPVDDALDMFHGAGEIEAARNVDFVQAMLRRGLDRVVRLGHIDQSLRRHATRMGALAADLVLFQQRDFCASPLCFEGRGNAAATSANDHDVVVVAHQMFSLNISSASPSTPGTW